MEHGINTDLGSTNIPRLTGFNQINGTSDSQSEIRIQSVAK